MPKIKHSPVRFTDRFVASRKPSDRDWHDADVKGLILRVGKGGHRSFLLGGLYPGSAFATRRSLGYYFPKPKGTSHNPLPPLEGGALTLVEAREKARRWKDLMRRGIDPRDELERERERNRQKAASTFAGVASDFLDKHVKGPAYVELQRLAAELKKRNPGLDHGKALRLVTADPANRALVETAKAQGIVKKAEAIRLVENEFVARWRSFEITEITPAMASTAIAAVAERGPFEAYNAFGHLSRLFSWAIGQGKYGVNISPMASLRAADIIGTKKELRNRVLRDDELRSVWVASGRLGYPLGPMVRMLILTGQRLREIADMRWREIDLTGALLTIPADRMKGGRAHEVPLAPQALALLKSIDDLRLDPPKPKRFGEAMEPLTSFPVWDKGDYVFSFCGGERPPNSYSKIKKRLDELVEAERRRMQAALEEIRPMDRWTFHDLRRTARTHFSALPVQDLVRELAIAHAKPGLHAVYDQHSYQSEKRHLFVLWEQRLSSMVEPSQGEVADITQARAKRSKLAKRGSRE
jgi:integrase